MSSYLRLAGFLGEIKRETFLKIWIGLLITATYVSQAYAIAQAISAVFGGGNAMKSVVIYLLAAVAAIGVRALIIRYNEGYTKKMAARVKGAIRSRMIDKLMKLGPGYLNDKRSGNVQSLITDGVESFEVFLVNYIPQVFVVLISVIALVAYITILDPVVGVIVLAAAVLSVVIPHLLMPMVSKIMIDYWQSYALLNSQYIDTMQGMDTLKAFHASKHKGKELSGNVYGFARESIRNTGISLIDSAIIVLLMAVGTSISIAIAAGHTANGSLPVASLLTILFLVGECIRPLYDMNTYWHGSYLGFSVAQQLFNILDEPVVLKEKENAAGVVFQSRLPSVTFEKVSFCYHPKAPDVVKKLDLHINPGQTVAIVGKSGSGKSTIINLMLRFYDVKEGRIFIDGKNIEDYSLEYLRSQISVVFQDTYLFYGSIEENLRMAKPDATAKQVEKAAKAANAHEFIQNLPQGYKTVVGERGVTLSGGERQRIAIARAILKDAPLLLLDEATSSVDAASEAVIQQAMERLAENRTTIIIAHRLSTIQNVQNIFVMEEGVLAEQGTHKQLMEREGVYASLIHAQQKEREDQ